MNIFKYRHFKYDIIIWAGCIANMVLVTVT